MIKIGIIDLNYEKQAAVSKYISGNIFESTMHDMIHRIKRMKLKEKRKPWDGIKHKNLEKEFRSRRL